MKRRVHEMDEVLSRLTLAFLQLERSGKCCQGVTLSQCHILEILLKRGALAMIELSRRMGLAKSTITRGVMTMARQGWIEQVRDDGDRRLINVRLTGKGREMAESLSISSRDYVRRILKHLPEEKIPQIIESLEWLLKSVEKEI